jgi:transposase
MTDFRSLPRRRHSAEFKARVLAECAQPGVSVAGVALANGVNANMVHKWMRTSLGAAVPSAKFLPVAVTPEAPARPMIQIEVRRGTMVAQVNWPVSAAGECAIWLRELLR